MEKIGSLLIQWWLTFPSIWGWLYAYTYICTYLYMILKMTSKCCFASQICPLAAKSQAAVLYHDFSHWNDNVWRYIPHFSKRPSIVVIWLVACPSVSLSYFLIPPHYYIIAHQYIPSMYSINIFHQYIPSIYLINIFFLLSVTSISLVSGATARSGDPCKVIVNGLGT